MVLGFLRDLLGAPRPANTGAQGLHAQASFAQSAIRGAGPGVLGLFVFQGARVPALDGGRVLLVPFQGTARLRSRHPAYADTDGNIGRASPPLIYRPPFVAGAPLMVVADVFLPFAAFPDPNATIKLHMFVQATTGEILGQWFYENVRLEAEKHDRLNVLAAVCDAGVAAIRLTKPLERPHITLLRTALTNIYGLDDFGLETLRRYLKRADQTPLNDPWFAPLRLARDIGRFVQPAEQTNVLEFLLQLAGADASPISEATYAFVSGIGAEMGIHPGTMRGLSDRYRARPEPPSSDEGSQARSGERVALAPPRLRTPYEILGLHEGASMADVKAAYRALVKKYHPDVAGADDLGARMRFLEVQRAYETLMGEAA
jgi:DnaJ-domain-containing protein 1